MLTANFTENWNGALICDCFSRIEISQHKFPVNGEVEIQLKGQFLGYAKVVSSRTLPLSDLNDNVARHICGNTEAYLRTILNRMFGELNPRQPIFWVTIQWTQRHLPAHEKLFASYWAKAREKHTIAYRDTQEGEQLEFAINEF